MARHTENMFHIALPRFVPKLILIKVFKFIHFNGSLQSFETGGIILKNGALGIKNF